jgi:hypothetical protein
MIQLIILKYLMLCFLMSCFYLVMFLVDSKCKNKNGLLHHDGKLKRMIISQSKIAETHSE